MGRTAYSSRRAEGLEPPAHLSLNRALVVSAVKEQSGQRRVCRLLYAARRLLSRVFAARAAAQETLGESGPTGLSRPPYRAEVVTGSGGKEGQIVTVPAPLATRGPAGAEGGLAPRPRVLEWRAVALV